MHATAYATRDAALYAIHHHAETQTTPVLLVDAASGAHVVRDIAPTTHLSLYIRALGADTVLTGETRVSLYYHDAHGLQHVTFPLATLDDWYAEMQDHDSDLVLCRDYADRYANALIVFSTFMQTTPVFVLNVLDDRVLICLNERAMRQELDELALIGTPLSLITPMRYFVAGDQLVTEEDVLQECRTFTWLMTGTTSPKPTD